MLLLYEYKQRSKITFGIQGQTLLVRWKQYAVHNGYDLLEEVLLVLPFSSPSHDHSLLQGQYSRAI
tara:strand:- start:121 stop:318 length:198 start_codon:yes stop_codon:yes gene_type:complete